MEPAFAHRTVLLHEAVEVLNIKKDGCYVDGTFGRGGHSREILKKLGSHGCLLGIDKDSQAVAEGVKLAQTDNRFHIQQGSFLQIIDLLHNAGLDRKVDGLLLDLGVSSPQLDDSRRGFSFLNDGPLDMRMDTGSGLTAAEWLNSAEEGEIAEVLSKFGEERFSRRIARAIVEQRDAVGFHSTRQLADVISRAIPRHEKHKHPATRSFQAIRIFINSELEELERVLEVALSVLTKGGRLVVISFHSLEDRIVKRFMRKQAEGERLPPGVPVQFEQVNARLKLVGKAIFPSQQEIDENPRSRSAVMRVAEVL